MKELRKLREFAKFYNLEIVNNLSYIKDATLKASAKQRVHIYFQITSNFS